MRAFGIISVLLLVLGCGGEEGTTEPVDAFVEEDLFQDVEAPGEIALPPEKSLKSCPGYKKNDSWPESYQEFCQEFLTPELLETGNGCFYVPDTGTAGCFCKICALQGVEINCVKELCN